MEPWRDELYHHGILGQKWGARNGPPYPLGAGDHSASERKKMGTGKITQMIADRKKKKARAKALEKAKETKAANEEAKRKQEEHEQNREKVLKTGKASDVLKYKGELSEQEYAAVFKRLENEARLKSLSLKEVKSGYDKAMSVLDKIGDISNHIENGVRGYNTAVKLVNSLAGANLPKIGEGGKKKVDTAELIRLQQLEQQKIKTQKDQIDLDKTKRQAKDEKKARKDAKKAGKK